jgi:hypothetical protein
MDDFFAPHEKLPASLKFVRFYALLIGFVFSVPLFIIALVTAFSDNTGTFLLPIGNVINFISLSDKSGRPIIMPDITAKVGFVALCALVQAFFLVPCWRAWLLKKWACITVAVEGIIFLIIIAANEMPSGTIAMPIFFSALFTVFYLFLFYIVTLLRHWPKLKPGF